MIQLNSRCLCRKMRDGRLMKRKKRVNVSVKTGRVKQLEAFGEITNRMTGAKGPRRALEKE